MNIKLIAVTVVILGALIGLGALSGGNDSSSDGTSNSQVSGSQHSQGVSEKNVVLTEAIDFECPACAQFHPIVDQIKEEYKDRVVFEVKHYPITGIHPNALAAHRAAEAVSKQSADGFWSLHDTLFESRNLWISSTTEDPRPVIDGFVEALGIDMDQYRTDFISSEVNDIINADREKMTELGAEGTPSFFLNNVRVLNNELDSLDEFRAVLDEALGETSTEQTDESAESANTDTES
ncbi:MAG: thioredoxin domain-containing protein [Patescibacteria group bacterium]